MAVWGESTTDWVVLSEGLLQLLKEGANGVAARLTQTQPWLFETELGRRLQQIPVLPECETPSASFLYFAAITFFVGHEAGHHFLGHDGFYTRGAHAERVRNDPADGAALTRQALEFQADRYATAIARRSMIRWLTQLWDIRTFSSEETTTFQVFLSTFLSVGSMMALVLIKPRAIEDWTKVTEGSHPPALLRMVGISDSLTAAIKEHMKAIPDGTRRSVRLFSMSLAAGATIAPGSSEEELLQERLAREGDAAALRAVGLRRALHDPATAEYMELIQKHLNNVLPHLTPRKKSN